MRNHKNSFSLSKLNFKIPAHNQNSQRSLKNKLPKRVNQTHIEKKSILSSSRKPNHQPFQNEYYQTVYNQSITSREKQTSQKLQTRKVLGNLVQKIQQKMRQIFKSQDGHFYLNQENVVLQQSDVDQQFANKIIENKNFLKEQRQKQNLNRSRQKLHTQIYEKKQVNKSKKLSLINHIKMNKHIPRMKTRSFLPQINPFADRILQQSQFNNKKHRKNSIEKNNIQLSNIFCDSIEGQNQKDVESIKQKNMIDDENLKKKQQHFSSNSVPKKNSDQINKKISLKKAAELKIQSKMEELKDKISQRNSKKLLKNHIQQKPKIFPNKKKNQRLSSHSIYDNIQQFLSNPHQNNTKSQRKFVKIYEKIENDQSVLQKEKSSLKQKIIKIEAKIKNYQCKHNLKSNQQNQIQKLEVPTTKDQQPSSYEEIDYGALQWRRLEKNQIQKSSFENQIKQVKLLEKKGQQNLQTYLQNKKMLHELKMIKASQQMLKNNQIKAKSSINLQKFVSL